MSKEITLEKARMLKTELEFKMAEMLTQFGLETGLRVTDLNLNPQGSWLITETGQYINKYDITLETDL